MSAFTLSFSISCTINVVDVSVLVPLSSTQLVAMDMVTSTMVTLVIWMIVLPFMAHGAEITDVDQFVTEYLERALVTKLGERSNVGNRKPWEEDVRLPRHIIPLHYDIYLHPNLETDLFSGHVTIQIEVTQPSQHLQLHTKDLNITRTELTTEDGHQVDILLAFEFGKNQFWVIQPVVTVQSGKYFLLVSFTGNLASLVLGKATLKISYKFPL